MAGIGDEIGAQGLEALRFGQALQGNDEDAGIEGILGGERSDRRLVPGLGGDGLVQLDGLRGAQTRRLDGREQLREAQGESDRIAGGDAGEVPHRRAVQMDDDAAPIDDHGRIGQGIGEVANGVGEGQLTLVDDRQHAGGGVRGFGHDGSDADDDRVGDDGDPGRDGVHADQRHEDETDGQHHQQATVKTRFQCFEPARTGHPALRFVGHEGSFSAMIRRLARPGCS